MHKILDNISELQKHQLSFLQKIIETVNDVLFVRKLTISELKKIVVDAFIAFQNNADCDRNETEYLCNALIEMVEDDEAVEYLIAKLDDYQTRYFACSFLGWYGYRAKSALPKLIDLSSGHSSAAGAAQKAIIFIGGAEKEILYSIKESLRSDDDESFRHLSNLAARTSLNGTNAFFETMRMSAEHNNPNIRESVADIIIRLRMDDQEKIRAVLDLLLIDSNEAVKNAASNALDSLN